MTVPQPLRKVESVRKRDGRVMPYDERKISAAIAAAARSAGRDAAVGSDLAAAVTTFLERYRADDVPSSAEIRRLVEKILFETGHADVAQAYREGRSAPAGPPPEDLFPSGLLLVDGATRAEVTPWGRERITAALVREAGIGEAAAAEIAGAVEQKILGLGHSRVSTSFIRELVNHELIVRGHASRLRRQIVVGLPKYDLGQMVSDEEGHGDPDGLCRVIGRSTLKQYALQEIFTRDVSDAHLEGRLHLHGLEEPLKLHALPVAADALLATGVPVPGSAALSAPAGDARAFTAQIGQAAADARRFASGPATFLRLSGAYDRFLRDAAEVALGAEIEHLAAALGDGIPAVDPSHRTALPIAWLGRAVVRFAGAGEDLLGFCRAAVERGMTFEFERPGPPPAARGATAQAITINLPQAYFRSEAGTDFYAELETAVELAVKAHLQKRHLLRRFVDRETGTFGRGAAVAPAFDGFEYVVGVAGLNEAVQLLSGDEILGSDRALRLALRIVSYLDFRLREEASRQGLRLSLGETAAEEAPERFARIDVRLYPRARGVLGDRPRYLPGLRVRGGASFEDLAVEARFHSMAPSARVWISRSAVSPEDLFSLLGRLHAETLAAGVTVE